MSIRVDHGPRADLGVAAMFRNQEFTTVELIVRKLRGELLSIDMSVANTSWIIVLAGPKEAGIHK